MANCNARKRAALAVFLILCGLAAGTWYVFLSSDSSGVRFNAFIMLFVLLFIFRYTRLVVHIFAFWCLYTPTPIPEDPTYDPSDCTVILPTVDPDNEGFKECIESCLKNKPGYIHIVTVGSDMVQTCENVVRGYQRQYPQTEISVYDSPVANKRRQVALAIPHVRTDIICLLDDHVYWPSRFLETALAPFQDPNVGGVGTNKRVRRSASGWKKGFWNMLGALYLERHNFEIRATNAIDGGVFVISGRTALYRSEILKDEEFLHEFLDERFFFGRYGPLNADDDNCITRWVVQHGWHIKIQYCRDAMIETTLGTYPKFLQQCLRWVRTTWRSNSATLFSDRTVWRRQPWCVYAVYITSFVNFALFYDLALISCLFMTPFGNSRSVTYLVCWMFGARFLKLASYFRRHPTDLLMLPGYIIFAYFHSFIKLYAGLTFYETSWGSRDLETISSTAVHSEPSNVARPNLVRIYSERNIHSVVSSDVSGPSSSSHYRHFGGPYGSLR